MEKAKEKLTKKTSRTKEAMEKGPTGQKPIKIKLCRSDQEPEDFIQKIHQETTNEEAEEEPTEILIRCSKKRDRKQQAEEPAPTVVVETQEQEEPALTMVVKTQE